MGGVVKSQAIAFVLDRLAMYGREERVARDGVLVPRLSIAWQSMGKQVRVARTVSACRRHLLKDSVVRGALGSWASSD